MANSKFASTRDEILQAVRENSVRRGLFFLKNLASLDIDNIIRSIETISQNYDMEDWRTEAESVGIEPAALSILEAQKPPIPYPYYFCLPSDLVREPKLILYYRNVAMISNKVMNNIGLDTTRYEVGLPIEEAKAYDIAEHLNKIISSLVLRSQLLGTQRHLEMAFSNLGASLDGGWRNEVGRLAYVSVLTPIIIHLHKLGKIASIQYKTKGKIVLDEDEESEFGNGEQITDVTTLSTEDLMSFMDNLEEHRVVLQTDQYDKRQSSVAK